MKITNVFFHELNGDGKMKAFANVELDGQIIIKGFKVFEGVNGAFVKVPQERNGDDWYDTIRWSDKSYYEKDAKTHPLLAGVLKRWEDHQAASGAGNTSSDGGEEQPQEAW